jgi:hypothetical protein
MLFPMPDPACDEYLMLSREYPLGKNRIQAVGRRSDARNSGCDGVQAAAVAAEQSASRRADAREAITSHCSATGSRR